MDFGIWKLLHNLIKRQPSIASNRLQSGPANATETIALLGFLKYLSLTWTGFAQPKPQNMNNNEPIKSRWLSGLKESLPVWRGVGSPRKSAIYACAISCKTNDTMKIGIMYKVASNLENTLARPLNKIQEISNMPITGRYFSMASRQLKPGFLNSYILYSSDNF